MGHSFDTVKINKTQIVADRPGISVFENNLKNKHKQEQPYFDDYKGAYSGNKLEIINKIIEQKKEIKILEAIVSQRQ